MRRICPLFAALLIVALAPAAQAATAGGSGTAARAAQISSGPSPQDTAGDGVLNADDLCPNNYGDQPNGCSRFVWRFFFIAYGFDQFLGNKQNSTRCEGPPGTCKATHVKLTLSAATAKEAGIAGRQIAKFSVAIPYSGNADGFGNHISSANRKKLARLHKIVVSVQASVTLTNGKVIEADPKTRTIYRKKGVGTQFNSDNAAGSNQI